MESLPVLGDWIDVCSHLGLFTESSSPESNFAITPHNPLIIFKLVAHLQDEDVQKLG
jgi:hypothetical protein